MDFHLQIILVMKIEGVVLIIIHFEKGGGGFNLTHQHFCVTGPYVKSHSDETKYDSSVVKMGGNENVVITFTVVSHLPFLIESQ